MLKRGDNVLALCNEALAQGGAFCPSGSLSQA